MSYSGPPPVPPGGSVPPRDEDQPQSESNYGGPAVPGSPYLPEASGEPGASPYGVPSPYGAPSPYDAPAPDASPYGTPPSYGAPLYGPVSPYATSNSAESNGLGVTALVMSILGFTCGGIFAVVGLLLAIQARKAVREGRANNGGVTTAAFVLGIIATAVWAVIWLATFVSN